MNDQPFKPQDHAPDELRGALRQRVMEVRSSQAPAEPLSRVIDRAIRIPMQTDLPLSHPRRIRLPTLCALAVAAALLIAATLWLLAPRDSWAQVVKAVQMKPWIHGTAQSADGKQTIESWISFIKQKSGRTFADGSALFDDWQTKTRYEYVRTDPTQEGTIYRETSPNDSKDVGRFKDFFESAMRGDQSLNANSIFGSKILSQKRQSVVDHGTTWTDYDLQLQPPNLNHVAHLLLRVDPKTNLPAMMKITGQTPDGKDQTIEMQFDYPSEDAGPRDIYALGAPRTAKVVDRMPSAKLADVIAGIEASEKKFGAYFAVAVKTGENSDVWRLPWVNVMWRDGRKYRFELAMNASNKTPTKPDAGANMVAWWKTHLNTFNCVPSVVSDGNTVWMQKKDYNQGTPMEKLWTLSENDDGSPINIAMIGLLMPDLAGYHRAPYSGQNVAAQLLPNQPDGPPNCVWVEVRYTDQKTQKETSFARLCFDPAHTYLLRRYQWYNLADQPEAKSPSYAFSIDEFAQTPSGVWYPTCVHEKHDDGDTLIWYYVDFNAKLPDSLFKPEVRTGEIE